MTEPLFCVTDQELSIEAVSNMVINRNAGAIVTFTGTVRELTYGRKTISLHYQAYQTMAEKQLQRIGDEIKERWPDATTAIWHRTAIFKYLILPLSLLSLLLIAKTLI